MIFFIALAAMVALPVISYLYTRDWPLVPMGLMSGPALGIVLTVGGTTIADRAEPTSIREAGQDTVMLVAVESDDATTGSGHFLTGETVDEKDVFRYRYADGDGIKTSRVDAEASTLIEDVTEDSARMVTTTTEEFHWWAAPWPTETIQDHAIHVPAGTVDQKFDIAFD